jgi:hypothetical protein
MNNLLNSLGFNDSKVPLDALMEADTSSLALELRSRHDAILRSITEVQLVTIRMSRLIADVEALDDGALLDHGDDKPAMQVFHEIYEVSKTSSPGAVTVGTLIDAALARLLQSSNASAAAAVIARH